MDTNDNAPLPVTNETPIAKPVLRSPSTPSRLVPSLWNVVLPIVLLLLVMGVILYLAPNLLYHWRIMDAQAEAEISYTRRRAELRAEAEHADQRLDLLDKRGHLVSLGFRELARKVSPVVVNVVNYREATEKDLEKTDNKRLFHDPDTDKKYVQEGVGSGIIYKPGVILTNHHVIRDANRLWISFPSGRSIGMDAVALSDEKKDLAVIRLPDNMPAALKEETQKGAEFADSAKDAYVGDWVIAMGSPLGLRHTVTHGIISAKGRLLAARDKKDDDLIEFLQTDAAINPGNSGGPLFDQLGRVVGINVMIASDSDRGQGIGFAIPSNTVTRIADHLLAHGEVPRGYLGIEMSELSPQKLKALKIDDGAVVVKTLVKGEAAAKAGIKPGDVIFRINNENLQAQKPSRHVRQIIGDLDPGAQVTLDIVRGEERMQIGFALGKRPANLP